MREEERKREREKDGKAMKWRESSTTKWNTPKKWDYTSYAQYRVKDV